MTRSALFLLLLSTICVGQESILTTRIAAKDWRIPTPEDVRFGQISIAKLPAGTRMLVTALQTANPRPPSPEHVEFPHQTTKQNHQTYRRATWVWNTTTLMRDSVMRRELVTFLREQRMNVVFLQLPPLVRTAGQTATFDNAALASVVALLKEQAIEVHALEGAPSFILPEQQSELVALVAATRFYNEQMPQTARFDGLHLDVEPYLMPGFGGARREEIFKQYLTLLRRVRKGLAGSKMIFGADIPYWLDNADEWTGTRNEIVENGERVSVLDRVLDIVDEIGIMSYRTIAGGPGGVIEAAMNEVDLAGKRGKRAFVALETEPLPDEYLGIIRGDPYVGVPIEGMAAFHLTMRTAGDSIDVWYVPDEKCGEWNTMWNEEEQGRFVSWPVHRLIPVPASRLTFAESTMRELALVEAEVRQAFDRWNGFAGIAVHHWESLKRLRDKSKQKKSN